MMLSGVDSDSVMGRTVDQLDPEFVVRANINLLRKQGHLIMYSALMHFDLRRLSVLRSVPSAVADGTDCIATGAFHSNCIATWVPVSNQPVPTTHKLK